MSCEFWWNWWVQVAVAVGTLAVAALAIWGDQARAIFARPRIELRLHTFRGTPALLAMPGVNMAGGPQRARYYHLKAVNVRRLTVQNCRVLLTAIHKRGSGNAYTEIEFPVPFPFIWSGEEPGPELVTVTTERVFDFGRVMEGSNVFEPRLRAFPVGFDGVVRRGESVRYYLVVDASNYGTRAAAVFDVTWDGEYPVVSTPKEAGEAPWSA